MLRCSSLTPHLRDGGGERRGGYWGFRCLWGVGYTHMNTVCTHPVWSLYTELNKYAHGLYNFVLSFPQGDGWGTIG